MAPEVSKPLNVGRFEQDPCSLLTQAQAGQFIEGVRNSSNDKGNVAPICNWNGESGSSIGVGFIPGQGGLTTVYQNGRVGGGYFEPTSDVAGYPAAFTDALDDRKSGGCQIVVGVTNDEVFTLSATLWTSSPSYSAPCPVVTKAAELVVAKLKGGA